jgi:predicted Zn-dependent peptidase
MTSLQLKYTYTLRTLPNGLRLFHIPAEESPFTAVVLAYGVGAAHERPEEAGLAHLLEHLLFEDEQIAYDQRLQAVGGTTNAYTGQDYTVYYARVPQEAANLALELEAERLYRLTLSPDKIETQRRVVAEEFRQRYLNPPYADRFFHIQRMLFPGHPYAIPVIGHTPEEILQLPDEALKSFYERYYTPDKAVLVVAGDADMNRAVELFSGTKEGAPLPEVPSAEGLPLPQDALVVREGRYPQAAVFWAYRLPPLEDPAIPAMDLLDDYLGGGSESLLPQKLVYQKGLATRLHTYTWAMHAATLWVVEAYLAPGVSVERFEQVLEETLKEALSSDLAVALQRYRPMRYLDMLREWEGVLGRALALAHDVLAGHPEWYEDPLAPYEALTPADLTQTAQTFLRPERRIRLHYLPTS